MTDAACVLAIDPGNKSGVAVVGPSGLLLHNELSAWDRFGRDSAVRQALDLGAQQVVVERFQGGRNQTTVYGAGAAYGAWRDSLLAAGIPRRRIVQVYPNTWRSVLGSGRHDRAQWKAMAVVYTQQRFGVRVGVDAAEAVCIACWALGRQL